MSKLAGMLLELTSGYKGGIVRGPIHWMTDTSWTVADLWAVHSQEPSGRETIAV